MCLAPNLGEHEPVVPSSVFQRLLRLLTENGGLPWGHATLKDPDYQTSTPSANDFTPRPILLGGGAQGNYRAISTASSAYGKCMTLAHLRTGNVRDSNDP